MSRRYEIDIMNTFLLQVKDHFLQLKLGVGFSQALLTDRMVLAENTSEITAGKEYCTRAIFACYARFFAEVGGGPCNTGEKGTSAYSGGIGFSSLCTAFSRTKAAF
jgi:hypothetical protein